MADWLTFLRPTDIALPTTGTEVPPPEVPGPAEVPAANIEDWLSMELPQFLSEAALKLGVIAIKPNDSELRAYAVLNGTPSETALIFQPAAVTVTQEVTRLARSVTLSVGGLADEELLYLGTAARGEFVKINSETNLSYTIDRGVGDTIPLQHAVGTQVWRCTYLWQSGSLTTDTPYSLNLQTVTSSSRRISDRTDAYNIVAGEERYDRPICPAYIQVGGMYLPTRLSEDIVITYRGRQRTSMIDWYSNVKEVPEAGWEIRVQLSPAQGDVDNIYESFTAYEDAGTVTIPAADVRSKTGGQQNSSVTLTISAIRRVAGWHYNWGSNWDGGGTPSATAGTVTSYSQWQHTFMWTTALTGGWHYDWGRDWGGT